MVLFDEPGRRREEIYIDKGDYIVFIELLQEASEVFNVCIAASMAGAILSAGFLLLADEHTKSNWKRKHD